MSFPLAPTAVLLILAIAFVAALGGVTLYTVSRYNKQRNELEEQSESARSINMHQYANSHIYEESQIDRSIEAERQRYLAKQASAPAVANAINVTELARLMDESLPLPSTREHA